MSLSVLADDLAMAALIAGSLLCLSAAVGITRLPTFFSRLHAATKPQVLGVLLVLLAVGLRMRSGLDVGMLVLVGAFQLLTVPVAGQMMARAYYRASRAVAHSRAADGQAEPGVGPQAPQRCPDGSTSTPSASAPDEVWSMPDER